MAHITNSSVDRFTVGVALDGAGWHPAAWRAAGAQPERLFSPQYWGELADTAESAGLDYLTIVDELGVQQAPGASPIGAASIPPRPSAEIVTGRLDAALLASWIAPRTERIGLIPTVTTTHTEPFHVATGLQTLDHVSLGRAGWQLRISGGAADAAAFGRKAAPQIDANRIVGPDTDPALTEMLDEAADSAEVARRLWDSWERDAIIRDAATGRFLDRDRLHHIDFEGDRFSVVGPSIVPTSPQAQLPITVLAHATPIFRLAVRAADVVFVTPHPDPSAVPLAYAATVSQIIEEIRGIEREIDRESLGLEPLRIVADLVVALDEDPDSAHTTGLVDEETKATRVGAGGTDAADAGVPDAGATDAGAAGETGANRLARLNTLGSALVSDAHVVTGSSENIADLIAEWRSLGIDGVRLRPLEHRVDLDLIATRLLPELRRRGIAAELANAPGTLRQAFGLGETRNRYAKTRAAEQSQDEAPNEALASTKEYVA